MAYAPKPLDTSHVVVEEDLRQLVEQLAENVHEVWARNRMQDGWRYGPHRDDARKEHPDLVPYRELADDEKKYDRETALETIKVILALGYSIRR